MNKIFFIQQDFIVGHIQHNQNTIINGCRDALEAGARIVITPELSLTGYIPEDRLYGNALYESIQQSLATLCAEVPSSLALLVGLPIKENNKIYNAVVLIQNGQVQATYKKNKLPNNSVFDECRYFTPSDNPPLIFMVDDVSYAVQICEDLWHEDQVRQLKSLKVSNVLALNGSPFYWGKQLLRENKMQAISQALNATVYYINSVGGQDDLVFDGASFAMNANGQLLGRMPAFTACNGFVDSIVAYPSKYEAIYEALKIGLQAYCKKSGLNNGVILGLSGGVDSALVATMAVDALGADAVNSVMMPTQYTSQTSLDAAALLAKNLTINYSSVAIGDITDACHAAVGSLLVQQQNDVTAENIQARTRGLLLMALANNHQWLLLATGNKTEMACGYATLYGDMCGGFAPIKDVLKTEVWALCRYINEQAGWNRIPTIIIERAPSAELRDNQTDQDTLPAYDVLDEILTVYLAQGDSSVVANCHGSALCDDVYRRLHQSEFKRKQAPIGTKISEIAFGKDWRMPIANALFDDKP